MLAALTAHRLSFVVKQGQFPDIARCSMRIHVVGWILVLDGFHGHGKTPKSKTGPLRQFHHRPGSWSHASLWRTCHRCNLGCGFGLLIPGYPRVDPRINWKSQAFQRKNIKNMSHRCEKGKKMWTDLESVNSVKSVQVEFVEVGSIQLTRQQFAPSPGRGFKVYDPRRERGGRRVPRDGGRMAPGRWGKPYGKSHGNPPKNIKKREERLRKFAQIHDSHGFSSSFHRKHPGFATGWGPDGARTQKHAPCESDSCWHVIWDWIQPSSAILSGCCGLKWWAPELWKNSWDSWDSFMDFNMFQLLTSVNWGELTMIIMIFYLETYV